MAHEVNEALRKSIHTAFGLFALSLRWLPWWAAAGAAAAAVIGNWLILHRIVGRSIARHERGWDAGIVLYPLAVLILILVFRHDLHIAGTAWALLAFGDGFATPAGKAIGGPRLPWNRDKTWAGFFGFIAAGFPAALLVSWFLTDQPTTIARWLIVFLATIAAAITESLPAGVDDNVTIPLAAGFTLWLLFQPFVHWHLFMTGWVFYLILNTVLAVAGYLARSVNLSGMIGGWLLGAIIIVCGAPRLYVALLAFFVLGTAATKLGYRRKLDEGLAQEEGGRRGFSHAFANVGVAAICAIAFSLDRDIRWAWAAIGSLATAAGDTVASEIGQLIGERAYMPLTFRRVPRGTEGAISLEGTLSGLAAAFVVGSVSSFALFAPDMPRNLTSGSVWAATVYPATICAACAFAGSYLESLAGTWNRTGNLGIANGTLNFFNTAVGAALAYCFAPIL
jgi:uncharacterized protein (TIGR00297 family)